MIEEKFSADFALHSFGGSRSGPKKRFHSNFNDPMNRIFKRVP